MVSDFSRTLGLLRKEKKISQRIAAVDLNVSQALLSHYENGLREPGLAFVVRAADYYGVSCDYLLGRSFSRDGSAVSAEQIPDISLQKDNLLKGSAYAMLHKKLLVNSISLLMDVTGQTGSRQLTSQVSHSFSLLVYQVFRILYGVSPGNNPALFREDKEQSQMLCMMELTHALLCVENAARGGGSFGLKAEEVEPVSLSPETLSQQYPKTAGSLLSLLQSAADHLGAQLHP